MSSNSQRVVSFAYNALPSRQREVVYVRHIHMARAHRRDEARECVLTALGVGSEIVALGLAARRVTTPAGSASEDAQVRARSRTR